MRLLDNKTLKIHEFFGSEIPPYAILSHTWGQDEVSFQEMQQGTAQSKAGFQKIRGCCETAAADGFEYSWVDTCCVDKTSSAELSEAINSMYRWYQLSDVCYVYLADVPTNLSPSATTQAMRKSRWFTRGWTLQELIAPDSVAFFDDEWKELGTKHSLNSLIHEITSIDQGVLKNAKLIQEFSVAQRMSWVSRRQTTRVEDLAYCLLGLFGVNMPMLYGEGERAFVRLQEEIIRISDDHTIFAWKGQEGRPFNECGLLATTPYFFRDSGSVVRAKHFLNTSAFSLTNRGIHLTVPFLISSRFIERIAVLDCQELGDEAKRIGIYLHQKSDGTFVRTSSNEKSTGVERNWLEKIEELKMLKLKRRNVFVRQNRDLEERSAYDKFWIKADGLEECGIRLQESYPSAILPDLLTKACFELLTEYDGYYFQFADEKGRGFIVEIKPSLTAIVKAIDNSNTLQWPEDIWVSSESDRVLWQHPGEKWWISVICRRSLVSGQRKAVVHISLILRGE